MAQGKVTSLQTIAGDVYYLKLSGANNPQSHLERLSCTTLGAEFYSSWKMAAPHHVKPCV